MPKHRLYNGVPVHPVEDLLPGWVKFEYLDKGSVQMKMNDASSTPPYRFDYSRMEEMFWNVQKNHGNVERIRMHIDVYLNWLKLLGEKAP